MIFMGKISSLSISFHNFWPGFTPQTSYFVRALEERSLREAAEERAEELRQALAQRKAAEQEAEMRRRAALRNALQKQVHTAEII
jgi:hypothetical protein